VRWRKTEAWVQRGEQECRGRKNRVKVASRKGKPEKGKQSKEDFCRKPSSRVFRGKKGRVEEEQNCKRTVGARGQLRKEPGK